MALADLAAANERPSRLCAVCHELTKLPPDKAALLTACLSNSSVGWADLSTELANDPDFNINIPPLALSRHGRGLCAAGVKLR